MKSYICGFPVVALMLIAVGCHTQEMSQLYGGRLDILANPDRAEAFRVRASADSPATQPMLTSDLSIIVGPVALNPQQTRDLSKSLARQQTYFWELVPLCDSPAEIAVRFWKGSESLTVAFPSSAENINVYIGHQSTGSQTLYEEPAVMEQVISIFFPKPSGSR